MLKGLSCNIFAHRKNSDRVSQLHKDLLGLTDSIEAFDRDLANDVLYLSLSDTFLEEHKGRLIFDSSLFDKEPILASMFEEAPPEYIQNLTYEDVEEALAKKFNFGISSYEEALKKVIDFNKNLYGGNHTFLATLEALDDGTYRTKVILNTEENQLELIMTIRDRLFAEDIDSRLKDYHVRVDVSNDKMSRYDTRNPKRDVDGYYGLIQLNKGLGNLNSLYFETGHFLIDALGKDNSIVKKMMHAIRLNPKIIEAILGEEALREFNAITDTNLEALGHIVGQFLLKYQLKPPTLLLHFKNLIMRAVHWISTKIPLGDRQYRSALFRVETLALKIAKSFLHGTFKGKVERAISTDHILYDTHSIPYNQFLTQFKKDIQVLITWKTKLLIAGVNTSSLSKQIKSMTQAYKSTLKELQKGVNIFSNWQENVTDTMWNAFQAIGQNLDTQVQRMDSLINRIKNGENIPLTDMANILKEALLIQAALKDVVLESANNYVNFLTLDLIDDIDKQVESIKEYLKNAQGVNGNFESMINEVQRVIGLKFITLVNGSLFVAIELHLSSKGLFKGIERHKDSIIDLEKEMQQSSTVGRTSWWTRMVDAMADCPDIINQLVAQAVEEEKHKAIQEVNKVKDDMIDLYEEMRKVGIAHTKELFERDENGDITNYLISERNWSQWEKDFEESKQKMREDFFNDNKDDQGWVSMEQMYSTLMYGKRFHEWLRDFHNKHSTLLEIKDSRGKTVLGADNKPRMVWVPALASDSDNNKNRKNEKVYVGQINKLKDNLKAVFAKYMVLKRKLDSLLDRPGQTNPLGVKAPQFRMSIFGRRHGLIHRWIRSFDYLPHLGDNPNDTAFGSDDDTFSEEDLQNNEGTDIYDSNFRNKLNNLDRIPVYGIRKINPKELSTDLVFTTIAYALMAYNYNKLNNVIGAIEQLSDKIYRERKVTKNGETSAAAIKSNERAYDYLRLRDYLSSVVYNKTSNLSKTSTKILGRLGASVSYLRLGWNYNSQVINGVTGLWEIMKEAGNEEYSQQDFWWALWKYITYWLQSLTLNVANMFEVSKHGLLRRSQPIEARTKLNLLELKFDFRGDREERLREYKVMSRGYGILKGRNITSMSLWIMSWTDAFMSRVGIMAAMHHIKMRNKNTGKLTRLWDIYEVKDGRLKVINGGKDEDWEVKDYQRDKILEIIMSNPNNLAGSGELGRSLKDAAYIQNDKFDPKLTSGHSVFILDGDDANPVSSSVITQDKLRYYTEYADVNAPERKIYLSYEPVDNDGNLNSRYWVVDPDTDKLIAVEYNSSGVAVVHYKGEDITLNDFFDKTCGEHKVTDTTNYKANYTNDNIWDNNLFEEQTYGDTNIAKYLTKTSYVTWDAHQLTRWRMRMRGINNRLHGVYNKLDKGAYDRTFIGPLLATLKRYAIGLINKNIGTGRVDLRTGKYREGIIQSSEALLKNAFLTNKNSVNAIKRQTFEKKIFSWRNPMLLGFAKLICGLAEVGAVLVCSTPIVRLFSTLATRGVAMARGDKNAKNKQNWVAEYMHKEGFAEIQNTNINRVMNMLFKMLTLTAMIMGLGLLDGAGDDDAWWKMKWLSLLLMRGYSASALALWPGDLTPNDEEYFSEEHLLEQARLLGEDYPFKITDIMKEILYRTWVEQASYNWVNPFCINSAISEFGNLFTNEIPAVSATLDVALLIGSWFGAGTYTLEDLQKLKKEGKSVKNYVETSPGSGIYKKIIQSGINKGMYNTSKKAFSVISPGKMFLPWRYGDETIKSIEYYQNRNAILSSWGMSAPKAFWNFFSSNDDDEEEKKTEDNE